MEESGFGQSVQGGVYGVRVEGDHSRMSLLEATMDSNLRFDTSVKPSPTGDSGRMDMCHVSVLLESHEIVNYMSCTCVMMGSHYNSDVDAGGT